MKLALVIPWFGREIKGGAEQQAWQIAARLAARKHQVEVLTTCCRSHQDDWETNHWPPGLTREAEGFSTRRFRVDARDRRSFDLACGALLNFPVDQLKPGVSPVSGEESRAFAEELIRSSELLEYFATAKTKYDRFIFLPYLYGPILDGIRIVGERGVLQPCLHNEAYAYLPEVAEAFRQADRLLFNSEGEQELAQRLFGPGIWAKSFLVGEGVEVEPDSRNGSAPEPLSDPFVLYLGRKDAGKNVPLLLKSYRRFRTARPNSRLRLVLAGHGEAEVIPEDEDQIEDLGVVSEQHKAELLRDCRALFQPSQNESFSRVIMEAWMHGKPVAAHAGCLATAVAVERSGGGWLASSETEWAGVFAQLARLRDDEVGELGTKGKEYAQQMADWDAVMDRYEAVLAPAAPLTSARVSLSGGQRVQIDQYLPNLTFGDAISNYAIWIRNELRALGLISNLHVRYVDDRMAGECQIFSPEALKTSDAVIYHHSVGSEITPHIVQFSGPKCMIYHNITPAEFFEPFRPDYAPILRQGREDLGNLAKDIDLSCGDSLFNSEELRHLGYDSPTVLPIPVDPTRWSFAPDAAVMEVMQDGRTNILFVGRIAPNKKQDDLLRAFAHYLNLDPDARLVIAGKAEEKDPYAAHLQDLVQSLDLADSVVLTGSVDDAHLLAYYQTANLFWSMSEHEGFCVPLIEAMWFDVPVLAFRSSAVPETMGSAGLMFTDKTDFAQLAALASLLAHDPPLRRRVIKAQRTGRLAYLPSKVRPRLEQIVARLVELRTAKIDQPAGNVSTL